MCSKSWRKGWRGALVCSALWLLTGAAAAQEDFLRQGEQDSSRAVEVLIPDQGLLSGGAPAAPEEASASQVEVLIPDRGLLSSDAPAVPEAAPAAPVAEVAKPAPAPAPVAPVAEAAKPAPAPEPKKEDEGWATVGTDGSREVQLDRGGVIDSDAGTKVAWVRINMLSNDGQDYAAIKAMNRFDCNTRSFITLKRVYLNARHQILREESVKDEAPVYFTAGSMDERLWREVCERSGEGGGEGGGAAALQDVAARVEQALAAAGAKATRGADGSTIVRMSNDEDTRAAPSAPAAKRARASASSAGSSASNRAAATTFASASDADSGRDAPLCRRGRQQAPIDIIERGPEHEAEPIAFDYRPAPFRVSVSKQDVRLSLSAQGQPSEHFYAGKRYQLAQVSLRMPGTRINARKMALDVQLLHKTANGAALMLVVPMVVGEYGESPVLEQILAALPARITRSVTLPGS
ncbi:MAG: hypothetical protein J6T92_04685, partial [Ottowia sp.]|nr:hypothetical protein [Ottowia sp.]